MGRVDDLGVVVLKPVEKRLLNVCVDVGLWLFDQQEVGDRLLGFLILEFQQFQGEEDQVRATQAQLMDRPFVAFSRFADKQLERLEQFVSFVRQIGLDRQG